MKKTKKEIQLAVMVIAQSIGAEDAYDALIKHYELPRLLEMIAYDIFIHELESSDDISFVVTDAIELLRAYAIELRTNGFVDFENN